MCSGALQSEQLLDAAGIRAGSAMSYGALLRGAPPSASASSERQQGRVVSAERQREHQPGDSTSDTSNGLKSACATADIRSSAGSFRRCRTSDVHRSTMVSNKALPWAFASRVVQELQGVLSDLRTLLGSSPKISPISVTRERLGEVVNGGRLRLG